MDLELDWRFCQGDQWCSFQNLDLDHSHFDNMEGVYIIWHQGGEKPRAVYVGQGNIRDRISDHRTENNITQYAPHGLYVTWAEVHPGNHDGVERYLAEVLAPLEGTNWPDVIPISVNLPSNF